MLHVELNRHLLYSWITLEAISYNCFHRSEGILKNFSIICRVCKPQYVAISGETSITYCIREMVHLILVSLEMITSCTTCLDLLRKKYRRQFSICLTTTDIFICSFNNMLWRHVFGKFLWISQDLPEIHGFATTWNIRNPVPEMFKSNN